MACSRRQYRHPGNTTYIFNGTYSYTAISQGEVQTGGNDTYYVFVSKAGAGWVSQQRYTFDSTSIDASTARTSPVSTTSDIVAANGAIRHENVRSECR